jgi:hypothetical protein
VTAAVCRPRTAVVRRALLTLLFLGGFLVLALAFGGSAQAAAHASGEPSASDGLLTEEAPAQQQGGARKPARLADERPEFTTRKPAARGLVGRLAAVVERTAGVTRPVGEAVHGVVGSSGLRDLPGRLGLGGSQDGPGSGTDGDAGTGGAPSTAELTTGGCPAHLPGDRMGTDVDQPGAEANRSPIPEVSAPAADHRTEPDDAAPGGRGAPAAPLPGQQPPALLAPAPSAYAGEDQSRSGGPHEHTAVLPAAPHAVPLRSGAPSAADRARTRERSGEIPQFPG